MHTVVILLYSYELRQCTNAQATVPPLCHVIFLQGFTSLIDGGEGERKGGKILSVPYYFDF